jgi:hypothetical protein
MDQDVVEFAKFEITLLRGELHNLKTCQFAFLTTAFTATGLLLGFIPRLAESGFSSLGFLAPLVVILPASCFFFDKARTITRIVGYYRVLETAVNPRHFPGWENALSLSRQEFGAKGRMSRFRRVMLMQQPHGYWSLAYYTFLSLSLLCLGGAWKPALSTGRLNASLWLILGLASLLVLGCLCRNLYLMWHLTVGESSYEANYQKWKVRLPLSSSLLEPKMEMGADE